MQAVLLVGIQATGKSSFYRARFVDTHVRINLDMLRTRSREARLLQFCCETRQPFVVDNTNVTRAERAVYIAAAREVSMGVVGYYFESAIEPALARNAGREADRFVPERGVRGTHARLELPRLEEGFDELHYVRLSDGAFEIEGWRA
jgi:predicted kinase